MYQFKTPTAKQKELTLFKGRNDYNKVVREMNEPPKDYEHIKLLVQEKNNTIANIENNINIESKNNIQIKSHKKYLNKSI